MAKRSVLSGKLRSVYQEAREEVPATSPAGSIPKRYLPRELRKVAFWMKPGLLDRARDAVYACAGQHLTLTAFVAQAFEAEIARLSKRHNHGKPFPPRPKDKAKPGNPPVELTKGARPK